jgi:hypothetical protein
VGLAVAAVAALTAGAVVGAGGDDGPRGPPRIADLVRRLPLERKVGRPPDGPGPSPVGAYFTSSSRMPARWFSGRVNSTST